MYKGILLLATAQDGNGQIYPIAVAVVNSENNESWSFFFKELKVVLPDDPSLFFVSDRHSSIGTGIRANYSLAKHGYCMYHIYQNFKRRYGRSELFDLFKLTAKAYTLEEFNDKFANLSLASPKIAKYVSDIGFHNWARAHFTGNRYNILTTNNSECLNGIWKTQRQWPLLSLFDAILATISKWFCERREKAMRWKHILAPTTFTVVEVNYRRSTKMLIRRLSEHEAEVMVGADSFSVDLKERTCTCRKFQVDQVPCVHAIAFAEDRKVELHNLVHPMYTNAMVREVYKETVRSVPPKSKWSVPPNVAMKKLSPPGVKIVVGRPRVNRLKAFWERSYYNRKCSYCGKVGHTTTYCWKRKLDGA